MIDIKFSLFFKDHGVAAFVKCKEDEALTTAWIQGRI